MQALKSHFHNIILLAFSKKLSNEDLCGLSPYVDYLQQKLENPKENYMQLQGGKLGSHNMKETKSSNCL